MKRFLKLWAGLGTAAWIGLVALSADRKALAAPADAGGNPPADPGAIASRFTTNVAEVLRLAESGVDEKLILAYIENAQTPFELSADGIIYLKDLGISPPIVAAMLHQDTTLREHSNKPAAVAAPPSPTPVEQPTTPPVVTPPATPPEPAYVTNAPEDVTWFYDTLQPYGTWVEFGGLGWCWQPRVVVIDRSWRPYCHGGQWVFSDCGWYWQSDYSWGWAPFHYGRWYLHPRCGWVWFPDRVWAPAWVCWRNSDTHCGWAPLPPGARFVAGVGFRFNNVSVGVNFDFGLAPDRFTFVEIGHLHDSHPHLHALPAARVSTVYHQTTVINNYIVGRNNTVINQGIAVDRVAAASHQQIRPVTIRELPANARGASKPDRIERIGATSVVYRPELKPPAKPGPVIAQKVDERHPVIQHKPLRLPTSTALLNQQPGRPASPRMVAPTRSPVQPAPRDAAVTPSPTPGAKTEIPGARTESLRKSENTAAPSRPTPGPSPTPPEPRQTPARQVTPAVPHNEHERGAGSRLESPKGREQRLSAGKAMPSAPPAPARQPVGQPSAPPHNSKSNDGRR